MSDVLMAPDGSWFSTTCFNGEVRIWNTDSLQVIASFKEHEPRLGAVLPDGRTLAIPAADGTVLRATDTWKVLRVLPGLEAPISFAQNGRRLAATSAGGRVGVWNCRTGAPELEPFAAHVLAANWVEFSADGRTLLTTAVRGTLRFWNASNGRPMLTFPDAESTAAPLLSVRQNVLQFWNKTTYRLVHWRIPPLPVADGLPVAP